MRAFARFPAFLACLIPALAAAGPAQDIRPAAREHVRFVDGKPWRFTSRLATLVELNFTLGYAHTEGKQAVSGVLDRIAARYGTPGKPAIAIRRIASRLGGSNVGEVPAFTLEDLLAGEVLVANNLGYLNQLAARGTQHKAIRDAVDSAGRGWLSIHGTGESGAGWKWLYDTLDPRQYQGHGPRIPLPVYKDLREGGHIVLQGVLDTNTDLAEVPMGFAPETGFQMVGPFPVRRMQHEYYRWKRDLEADSATKDRITVLLRRDSREAYRSVGLQYIKPVGDAHTYLFRVGKAMTSYFPAGHMMDELRGYPNSFDRGEGDLERYLGQLLFFLAGYDRAPCDAACEGLPLVDAKDRLAGTYTPGLRTRGLGESPRPDAESSLYSADGRRFRPWRAPLLRFRRP